MTRSKRLHRVANQMEQEQSVSSRRLAELRSTLLQEEARLETLRNHLASYRQGFSESHRNGALAANVRNYAHFTDRLQLAVDEQTQRVALAQRAYEHQLGVWKEQRARVKAVESVADKQAVREQRLAERVEQRFIDDLVTQRFVTSSS